MFSGWRRRRGGGGPFSGGVGTEGVRNEQTFDDRDDLLSIKRARNDISQIEHLVCYRDTLEHE